MPQMRPYIFKASLTTLALLCLGICIAVSVSVVNAEPEDYDTNGNGILEKNEVITVVVDYFLDKITKDEVLAVLIRYFLDAPDPTPTPTPTPIPTDTPTPIPTSVPEPTQTLAFSQEDGTPPEIVDVTLTPEEVDVSEGSASITLSVEATDDLSGIGWVSAVLTSPSGEQSHCFCSGLPLTSGSYTGGDFTSSIAIPQFSVAGTWMVDYIIIEDNVNNRRRYSAAQLATLGASPSFEVLATQEDETASEIADITLTPTEVDVSDGSASITLSVEATDDLSGIGWVSAVLTSPSGEQSHCFCSGLPLTSGSYTGGDFTSSIVIPQFSEAGTWMVDYIIIEDNVNNRRRYSAAQLATLGASPSFEVLATQEDETAPEIADITLTPTEVDVSDGSAFITLSVEATDDSSGIHWISAVLTSPSGEQSHCFCNGLLLSSGSYTDGVFTSSIAIPQFSEAGTWTVDRINIEDSVSNRRHYSAEQLTILGFAPSFEVVGQ